MLLDRVAKNCPVHILSHNFVEILQQKMHMTSKCIVLVNSSLQQSLLLTTLRRDGIMTEFIQRKGRETEILLSRPFSAMAIKGWGIECVSLMENIASSFHTISFREEEEAEYYQKSAVNCCCKNFTCLYFYDSKRRRAPPPPLLLPPTTKNE